MRYSFTNAQPKPLLYPNTQAWLFFLGLSLLVLVLYLAALSWRTSVMETVEAQTTAQREEMLLRLDLLNQQLSLVEEERRYAEEEVFASNLLLRESLRNLFALVPEQITLTRVQMEQKRLVLGGITPSQEVYSFLLAVPLRSIFTHSEVQFYLMPNSWYSFESVNTLEEGP